MTTPELMKILLENIKTQDSLVNLLKTPEDLGGLGWRVDADQPFDMVPEIAQGIPGDGQVTISRLIPAATDDKYLILLAEFDWIYVRRDLRQLLSSVRRYIRTKGRFAEYTGVGDTLFIVVTPDYEDVRFVLFEEYERRLPRIRSFGWSREFIGRTVLTHNLNRLLWSERMDWRAAWDVDALTEAFYDDFDKVFQQVRSKVVGARNEDEAHNWTQLLFNRLLFLAFIQRIGWLKVPTSPIGGYLFDLFRGHRGDFKTFLGLLRTLFDELDTPDDDPQKGRYKDILGVVPYLNGGLFARNDPMNTPGIDLPDEAFRAILLEPEGLFARYNFTVNESTPLHEEVAVDPEMLGQIFERLVNNRHQEGKYYTPRPIVSFMVDEAIKGYLADLGICTMEQATLLVDQVKLKDQESGVHIDADQVKPIREALMSVTAVDPACGSGAYLLGLLQKLFDLVDLLNLHDTGRKELYYLKLHLLQRCIHGVDSDEVAIRIARLRLWLSLVVENWLDRLPDGRTMPPHPLPNLDFRIECGDSLASPIAPFQADMFREQQIHELKAKKDAFAVMSSDKRDIAQIEIDELLDIINKWQAHSGGLFAASKKPFDWTVQFAEVFLPREGAPGGFDIVVANPPYVNSGELLRNAGNVYKNALVRAYPNSGSGTADLLVFFLDRALTLLRPGGHLAFITSNMWLKAKYGEKLRILMTKEATISDLINFHDGRVFQDVISYPLITIARKGYRESQTRYTDIPRPERDNRTPDVIEYRSRFGHLIPRVAMGTDGDWRIESEAGTDRLMQMRNRGISLSKYVEGFSKHGILRGIPTGLNEVKIGDDGKIYGKSYPPNIHIVRKEGVFIIDREKRDELVEENEKNSEIIKPLSIGRNIKRWHVDKPDRWLIFTRRGININEYPAVKRHLERYVKFRPLMYHPFSAMMHHRLSARVYHLTAENFCQHE